MSHKSYLFTVELAVDISENTLEDAEELLSDVIASFERNNVASVFCYDRRLEQVDE